MYSVMILYSHYRVLALLELVPIDPISTLLLSAFKNFFLTSIFSLYISVRARHVSIAGTYIKVGTIGIKSSIGKIISF